MLSEGMSRAAQAALQWPDRRINAQMGRCPIHDAKYLLSTELQLGQFGVFLQDSTVPGTETILAHSLPEQLE
jgi:hypothetical protein